MVANRADIRALAAAPVRAAWAPILVFLLHVFISRGLNAYLVFPPLDVPMHFFGGVAIAYFFASCLRALPAGAIDPNLRTGLVAVVVFAMTATASVLWEFAEFLSDRFIGTHAQLSLEDTLLDMALGVVGGMTFLAIAAKLRRFGHIFRALDEATERSPTTG